MVARPQRLGAALHRGRRTGGQRAGTPVRSALGVARYPNIFLRVTLGVHRHGAAVDAMRPSAVSVIGLAAANCGAVGQVLLDRGKVGRASGATTSPARHQSRAAFPRAPGLKEHRADLVSEGRHTLHTHTAAELMRPGRDDSG